MAQTEMKPGNSTSLYFT